MRVLKAVCCAAVLTAMLAPAARADEWNKKTILTFSGAVQVPGATLPAGSYVFKLADIPGNRHVVQVFDKDEKKIYTTILAIPNDRLEATDKPVVLFAERASGSPQAVKVWYYPGDRIGDEFVYPKSQAMRIAKETHSRVLAYNDDNETVTNTAGEVPSAMKNAQVGYFDENGNWQAQNQRIAVNSDRASNTADRAAANKSPETTTADRAAANAAPQTSTASNRAAADQNRPAATTSGRAASTTARNNDTAQATGTSGAQSGRRHLPRTASSLALFELLSGIALGGALVVRTLRVRAAEAR
jgi:hypothetical protein